MRAFRPIVILPALVVVLAFGVLAWRAWPLLGGGSNLTAGQLAPNAEFRFVDGTIRQLRQMRGKPVLVNFWATSCPICVAEMPDLMALNKEFAGRFELVNVAMPYDRADRVLDFQRRFYPAMPIALDPMSKIVNNWGPVQGTPTRVVVDREGRVANYSIGAIKPAQLRAILLEALADQTG